jgi:hypothetical protein
VEPLMPSPTGANLFQCCFCAGAIPEGTTDPEIIVIRLDDGGAQELFAHAKCLRAVVHPSTRLAVPDE